MPHLNKSLIYFLICKNILSVCSLNILLLWIKEISPVNLWLWKQFTGLDLGMQLKYVEKGSKLTLSEDFLSLELWGPPGAPEGALRGVLLVFIEKESRGMTSTHIPLNKKQELSVGLKHSVCCSLWCLPANQTAGLNQIQTSALSLRPVHLWREVGLRFQPRQLISFHLSPKLNTHRARRASGPR